jgi:hypothetical protein
MVAGMSMSIAELQKVIGINPDGVWGAKSRAVFSEHFTNREANGLNEADFSAAANRLGCSVRQIKAVRQVEAAASGFDGQGRPKILFERHKFHRFTGGRFSICYFSNPKGGGYGTDSWEKLNAAIATGSVDAAFMSCSWGAFQVMGQYWSDLGYPSPYALAWTCTQSEGDQLELMIRYIEHFGLADELRALTSNPASCAPFAAAYNGPNYRQNSYDTKLAKAMAE